MSTETLSLTDLRPRLSETIDRAHDFFDRFVITRRGKPEAVLLGAEDYQGLLETLDILSDQELVKRLARADQEVARGDTVEFGDLLREIESEAAQDG